MTEFMKTVDEREAAGVVGGTSVQRYIAMTAACSTSLLDDVDCGVAQTDWQMEWRRYPWCRHSDVTGIPADRFWFWAKKRILADGSLALGDRDVRVDSHCAARSTAGSWRRLEASVAPLREVSAREPEVRSDMVEESWRE